MPITAMEAALSGVSASTFGAPDFCDSRETPNLLKGYTR
jgi:hypothetical protein